jgi:hypothetical protein
VRMCHSSAMGHEYRPEDRAAWLVKGYRGSVIDHPDKWAAIQADIAEAIKQAVSAEREACAKVASEAEESAKGEIEDGGGGYALGLARAAEEIAAKIRARK